MNTATIKVKRRNFLAAALAMVVVPLKAKAAMASTVAISPLYRIKCHTTDGAEYSELVSGSGVNQPMGYFRTTQELIDDAAFIPFDLPAEFNLSLR